MESKQTGSARYARQKRFLMILPLLTIPSLTLVFWAFGGGKTSNAAAQFKVSTGLNLNLPDPKLKSGKTLDKLSFYEQAALDSAKVKEAEKLDPYWSRNPSDLPFDSIHRTDITATGMDDNRLKVYSKLDELKKALEKNEDISNKYPTSNSNPYSLKYYSSSNDVDRLQSAMQKMNQDKADDPEITQLNEMLDKIQAIQNPDRASDNDKIPVRNTAFSVKEKKQKATVSLLKPDTIKNPLKDTVNKSPVSNGFYSVANFNGDEDSNYDNAIEAIIPETQTIVTGATIKLALSKDVIISNVTLQAGTLVYGTASLSNERLKISVSSIRFQNSILPVALSVYDMDGQPGIYVPGSITRTVAKESANNSVSGLGNTTIDNSVGAEAANAGIEVAKNLFSKKVKLIKLTISAGYKVLLRDDRAK